MSKIIPKVQQCGHKNKVRHKHNLDEYRKLVDAENARTKAAYGPELDDMNTSTQSRLHLSADGVTYRSGPVKAGGEFSNGRHWRRS